MNHIDLLAKARVVYGDKFDTLIDEIEAGYRANRYGYTLSSKDRSVIQCFDLADRPRTEQCFILREFIRELGVDLPSADSIAVDVYALLTMEEFVPMEHD